MMHHNILFKFKVRENCKVEFVLVEICNAQVIPVNFGIFLIFSYSLDSPKQFFSVPTMRIVMENRLCKV